MRNYIIRYFPIRTSGGGCHWCKRIPVQAKNKHQAIVSVLGEGWGEVEGQEGLYRTIQSSKNLYHERAHVIEVVRM